jgi:ribosomal protein S12 methylthiotransferase accessory factor
MTDRSLIHRRLSPERALELGHAELHRLELELELVRVGGGPYATYAAAVRDRGGRVKARGSGKGFGRQAVASGTFETLEHFHMTTASGGGSRDGCSVQAVRDVAAQPALAGDRIVERMRRLDPWAAVGCGPYRSEPGGLVVWYPLAIGDVGYRQGPLPGDTFDYRPVLRYCSTSGVAAGAGAEDAVEHAMFELIERDAVSLSLLHWFLRQDRPVHRVDCATLPGNLHWLAAVVEREAGSPVVLAEVTSDIGIPAYLAFPERAPWPANIAGSGASTDPAYAIERALGEVLQELRMLRHYGTTAVKRRQAERVERWDGLRRCVALEWRWLEHHVGSVAVDGPASVGPTTIDTGAGAAARRALRGAGLAPLWRQLSPPDAAIAVVHVAVPGLEGFALVRTGHPVVPTGRGAGLWSRAA